MDPVNSARKHQLYSISTTTSPHQTTMPKKPASTCTLPPTSAKSSTRDSAWLVQPAVPSPSIAAGPSGSRRHKRSGSQSILVLKKEFAQPAGASFEPSRAVKSGERLDVGTKKVHLTGAMPRLHLKFTARPSGSTAADSKRRAEFSPGTSEARTSNLAVVTPARESDATRLKSTKREREDDVEDGNQSRAGAKRARKETSTGGRKGILKDPKKALPSNRNRRVRWAERLEDYNYPKETFDEKDQIDDIDYEMDDYEMDEDDYEMDEDDDEEMDEDDDEEEDETDAYDALPDNYQDQAQITPFNSRDVVPADLNNQQFFVAGLPLVAWTVPDNWFTRFLTSLSPKDVHDLLVAYETFYGYSAGLGSILFYGPTAFPPPTHMPNLPVPQTYEVAPGSSHPLMGTFDRNDQRQAGSRGYAHWNEGPNRAVVIGNYQVQGVPDLSTSPDLSDHSLTPPSPAQHLRDRSPDENVNLVLAGDECNEGGLDAEGALFPGRPDKVGREGRMERFTGLGENLRL